jgi:hypothetical protein
VLEKKKWFRKPNVQQEERKTFKEDLSDNPDVIFLGMVVGVVWVVWYGIS